MKLQENQPRKFSLPCGRQHQTWWCMDDLVSYVGPLFI